MPDGNGNGHRIMLDGYLEDAVIEAYKQGVEDALRAVWFGGLERPTPERAILELTHGLLTPEPTA